MCSHHSASSSMSPFSGKQAGKVGSTPPCHTTVVSVVENEHHPPPIRQAQVVCLRGNEQSLWGWFLHHFATASGDGRKSGFYGPLLALAQ